MFKSLDSNSDRLSDIQIEISCQRSEIRTLIEQNVIISDQSRAASLLALDSLIQRHPRYRDRRCVNAAYGQVYSQNNEDGIIAEIFARIGTDTRTFVEIAAGDGVENTTRLLLDLGWTGVWVEAGEIEGASIRSVMAAAICDGRLVYLQQKVDRDNVDGLIKGAIEKTPDYVSLDIDYNTSHIWSALETLKPRVICIEYNAHFPPTVDYEVPYDSERSWNGTTRFGASLKALERIGREANYSLVGCDIFGVNAFFVRSDLCDEDKFLAPFTAENHYEPPRFDLVQMRGHRRHAEF
ncbi:hypothetical protein CPY51_09225 [Rhizobium tubonense]|uniref:Methyltransferase FkbM domain-containing protein n=2 Tax=Rhizobium tubonense TaxID=484088 RepID=A0A2W4CQP6_9HYPH|nr:hypothetical protein CPY51_09225 [Rhizobium tubonense]